MIVRRCLLVTLLAIALPAAAQFRWVDESGRVNYGDAPPPAAKGVSRLSGSAAATDDSAAALPFELRRAMSQFPATLYSGDECAACDEARMYLKRRGVPFSEIFVETDVEAAELKRRTGTISLPVLTLGRQPNVGFSPGAWGKALDAAGYPARIELPASYRPEPPRTLLPRAEGPVAVPAPAASATARQENK